MGNQIKSNLCQQNLFSALTRDSDQEMNILLYWCNKISQLVIKKIVDNTYRLTLAAFCNSCLGKNNPWPSSESKSEHETGNNRTLYIRYMNYHSRFHLPDIYKKKAFPYWGVSSYQIYIQYVDCFQIVTISVYNCKTRVCCSCW